MMANGYLSVDQRQELEVQALIYKHVLAGASIPPQLLLLFNKTLLLNSSPSPNYYHYSPYYHPSCKSLTHSLINYKSYSALLSCFNNYPFFSFANLFEYLIFCI